MTDFRLNDQLAACAQYEPTYEPHGNSDHLPMLICALRGLDADTEALYRIAADYRKRLTPLKSVVGIATINQGIGNRQAYGDLLLMVNTMISHEGVKPALQRWLPQLLPALPVEAFHPVIRLGYGIKSGQTTEVAAALAYWLSTMIEVPTALNTVDLEELLRQQAVAGELPLSALRFGERFQELVTLGAYPQGSAGSLAGCAKTALELYQATRNFFVLHLVTATQALRQCVESVPELEADAVAAMTGAIAAAHLILKSPGYERGEVLPVSQGLDPEHCYKYVYSCLQEYKAYGDSRYLDEARLFAAAGLIPEARLSL